MDISDDTRVHTYSLAALTRYFLKLGTFGFGGPVALIGYMHRDLVEQRQWITEEEYREGLALAQLAPGPLAAQLGGLLPKSGHCKRTSRQSNSGFSPSMASMMSRKLMSFAGLDRR